MSKRGTNIFKLWGDALRDQANGKIKTGRVVVFGDEGYTTPDGRHFPSTPDLNGRLVTMSKKLKISAHCPNAEFEGKYPKRSTGYSVPIAVCRKCEHRLPGNCCAINKQMHREGNVHPTKEAAEAWGAAQGEKE